MQCRVSCVHVDQRELWLALWDLPERKEHRGQSPEHPASVGTEFGEAESRVVIHRARLGVDHNAEAAGHLSNLMCDVEGCAHEFAANALALPFCRDREPRDSR